MDLLSSPLDLSGIGPVRAQKLQQLGIRTLYDLITYFPRDYEDRTRFVPIDQLEPDSPSCFRATVTAQPRTARIPGKKELTRVPVCDDTGRLTLSFFNQPYVQRQLIPGEEYCFYGRLSSDGFAQMTNPKFEPAGKAGAVTGRLVPIYSLTAGLSGPVLSHTILQALDACAALLPEVLPETILEEFQLLPGPAAYRILHAPQSFSQLEAARRRVVFEEFFLFSLTLAQTRQLRQRRSRPPFADCGLDPFLKELPFRPTAAQSRVLAEVTADLQKPVPMNRLVQGDVGSGKTLIAAAAAYLTVKNDGQCAIMAPTEILAEQHWQTLSSLLKPLDIQPVLLTGSLKPAEKRERKAMLETGQAKIAVGTHALLSKDVVFSNLALVVADEQHKFGVAQRAALTQKGQAPHLLVMSATPIPRTLALLMYGDLDLSIIDQLPPGRSQVETFLVSEALRARVNGFIRKQVELGHQVYIVCPAVEDPEGASGKSAVIWADALRKTAFPEFQVGLLHGQMSGAEKEAALRQFSSGQTQILVATTVIEVGIDVPNATLMVIENAERFGLSQLHQLRGRVGRGSAQSYCVLVSSSQNQQTRQRLKALCATADGFRIAEEDLRLRGPGDFFGQRQHGLPQFKMANLSLDLSLLSQAQQAANQLLIQDPEAARAPALQSRMAAFLSADGDRLN